jgi:hypothetical protein
VRSLLAACCHGDPERSGQPSVSGGFLGNQLDCDVRPAGHLRQVLKLPSRDLGAADAAVQDGLIEQSAQVGRFAPVQDCLPVDPGR